MGTRAIGFVLISDIPTQNRGYFCSGLDPRHGDMGIQWVPVLLVLP